MGNSASKNAIQSSIDTAIIQITATANSWGLKLHDAYNKAIEVLKNIDMKATAMALAKWCKENPDKVVMIAACIITPF